MAAIEINSADKKRVDDLVNFVRNFAFDLPVEARFVLAIEIVRLFKAEIDELKRKGGK